MKKEIFITDFDLKRFKWLFNNSHKFDPMYKKHLKELEAEMQNASIVDPKEVPADVITMHSKFRISDLETGNQSEYTLVFPFDADSEQNKLSILAPLGVAVIGYRVGDVVEWNVPAGRKRIKIEEIIYQPEAAGNYYI